MVMGIKNEGRQKLNGEQWANVEKWNECLTRKLCIFLFFTQRKEENGKKKKILKNKMKNFENVFHFNLILLQS